MLHKLYGAPEGQHDMEQRYSAAECTRTDVRVISGDPDPRHISTSYLERQNLTMRMGMCRAHPADQRLLLEGTLPSN